MAASLHRGEAMPRWLVLADHGASYTVRMPLDSWVDLPPHPRQRDARKQANKSHWEFARVASGPLQERLRWVAAAELDGEVFKVDGHARALLWQTGGLPAPSEVFATVYRCSTRDELNALYSTFDAPDAAETMYDRVCGAYHEHGLVLQSKRLRYGSIVDALHIAARGTARNSSGPELDLYRAVGMFREELLILDNVDPQPEVFVTGLVAGALVALALEPRSVQFFARVSAGQGGKRMGLHDPVETILEMARSIQKENSTRQRVKHVELCGAVVTGAQVYARGPDSEGFWGGHWLNHDRLSEDALRAVNEMKARKGFASDPTL